jgi:exosortase
LLVHREGDDLAAAGVASPPEKPVRLTGRQPLRLPVVWASLAIFAALAWSYAGALSAMAHRWTNEADYSHGFLVPVFAAYLLWFRRKLLDFPFAGGSWWGLAFLAGAASLRWISTYFFYPLIDGPSLLSSLAGVTLLAGGWEALRWAWPAIGYLVFMMPLPGIVAGLLSHPLQRIATVAATWLLQLLGVPAISRGNVIWLTDGQIGVVEACSGLRMLFLFLAITVGASFLIKRPLWEKVFVSLSALGIGVVTNILRITVTAVLYEYVGKAPAERVFHDFAGWLMMPVATLLLWLELYVLSKILVPPVNSPPFLAVR